MKSRTQAWGIASLILGILGLLLFLMPYLGVVLSILAVVFYGIQRKHGSSGYSIAGLVTGIIGIVVNAVMLVIVVGLLAFLGTSGAFESDDVVVKTAEDGSTNEGTKVKSATLTVDRVTETYSNLDKIRITITNTGDVSIKPKFDITVTDSSGNVVCEGNPLLSIGSIAAGQKKTDEIQLLSCMFSEDGSYTVKVDMMDKDFNKLDSDSKSLIVNYWGAFGI